MPVRLESQQDLELILTTLRRNLPASIDELIDILIEAGEANDRLVRRLDVVEHGLQERPLTDTVLEAAGWVIEVLAFIFGAADYFDSGNRLGVWGWDGLVAAPVALALSAWSWQRRQWNEDELRQERDQIIQWRLLLTEINLRATLKLTMN